MIVYSVPLRSTAQALSAGNLFLSRLTNATAAFWMGSGDDGIRSSESAQAGGAHKHTHAPQLGVPCPATPRGALRCLDAFMRSPPYSPAWRPVPKQPRCPSRDRNCELHRPLPSPYIPELTAVLRTLQGKGNFVLGLIRAHPAAEREPEIGNARARGCAWGSEGGRNINSSPPRPWWIRGRRSWKSRAGEAFFFFFFLMTRGGKG